MTTGSCISLLISCAGPARPAGMTRRHIVDACRFLFFLVLPAALELHFNQGGLRGAFEDAKVSNGQFALPRIRYRIDPVSYILGEE